MTVQTESVTNVFEQAFDGLRKTAEANLEMQQELFRQWSLYWPGIAPREDTWVERAQKFQKDWAKLVKDSLNRHREVLDEQYRLGLESLDEAFRVAQSTDPQEYAKRCTALCKKCLEVVRESGELQVPYLVGWFMGVAGATLVLIESWRDFTPSRKVSA